MTTATAPPEIKDPWRLGPASAVVLKLIGVVPTGEEQAAILRCRKPRKLVVGGGQAGKSLEAIADFALHLQEDRARRPWTGSETLLYWLVAADYERCRAEWNYIVRFLTTMGLPVDASKRLDPGRITVEIKGESYPRIVVETKSGKDPRTLSMFSPDGIIICEASQIDTETYHKCEERVTASGGWLHLSGTYELGSLGWYPGVAAAWKNGTATEQSFVLPTPTNRFLFPGGINDPKIQEFKRKSSDSFFLERIMGIASPPTGLVFPEFRADIHIRDVQYNPDLPLYIWDDPGYGHAHAIEIAQIALGGQIQVQFEFYERGMTTEELIDIIMNQPWWKNPAKTLVIDPNYANQHQGTRSVAEIWLEKTKLATMGVRVGINEGSERLKTFLKVNPLTGAPGIVWNPRCKGVLSELGAYPSPFYEDDDPHWEPYSWKTDREGNIAGDTPVDKFNDGCKATIYGIVEHFGLVASGSSSFFEITRPGFEQPDTDRDDVLASFRGPRP